MWSMVIIPILTLAIGFLCGVMVGDKASENMQIYDLQRKVRRLENVLPQQK